MVSLMLDLHEGADHAVAAHLALVHVDEVPDLGAFADLAIADHLLVVDRVVHRVSWERGCSRTHEI